MAHVHAELSPAEVILLEIEDAVADGDPGPYLVDALNRAGYVIVSEKTLKDALVQAEQTLWEAIGK